MVCCHRGTDKEYDCNAKLVNEPYYYLEIKTKEAVQQLKELMSEYEDDFGDNRPYLAYCPKHYEDPKEFGKVQAQIEKQLRFNEQYKACIHEDHKIVAVRLDKGSKVVCDDCKDDPSLATKKWQYEC